MEVVFWYCLACVVYTYVGYPLLLAMLARWRSAPVERGAFRGTVSIIVAANNEETRIGPRIDELSRQLRHANVLGDVTVVSDGSTDRTADVVRSRMADDSVHLVELPVKSGKAAALTLACPSVRGDIVVFADVRQTWADDALARLLENFADTRIGAVSGDLVLESAPGVLAGVGMYWRFEKWLRKQESRVHSQVGVTGAICAVRRDLFRPIPVGTVLDDVFWPLQVVLQGKRVVHDERAVAMDRLPTKPVDEFRRKVRTLAGNFQLAARLPLALVPWRNPIFWQLLSHKLMRLVVPWALLILFILSWHLSGGVFEMARWAQIVGYGVGGAGLVPALSQRNRGLAAAGSFLVLNAAAWLGFWVWASGRCGAAWTKAQYQTGANGPQQVQRNAVSEPRSVATSDPSESFTTATK